MKVRRAVFGLQCLAAFATFALLLAAFPGQTSAADLEALIPRLADKDFASKITAVEHIAATGDARPVPVLEAMLAGRLAVRRSDGRPVITEQRGRASVLKDTLTLAEIGGADGASIDAVTVNSRLRGVLRGALGGLTLLNPYSALVTRPRLLVLDEPTEGIQPSIITDSGRVIRQLISRGNLAILLVEQYFEFARSLADSHAVMDRGEIVAAGTGAEMVEADVRRHLAV